MIATTLQVRPMGYALGAEVTGIDLREALDDATVARLRALWLEHLLLCFPGQSLGPDGLNAFGARFGVLDDFRGSPHHRMPGQMTISLVQNQPTGGFPYGQLWHSDRQFTNHPASATFLTAKDLPDVGGETMFANMYAAYESLSPAMRATVDGLCAVHDVTSMSIFSMKTPEQQANQRAINPPVVHPLVRVHPETGRKSIFVGGSVSKIDGMTAEESKPLIDFLTAHSTRYELVYRHRWSVGDLLMWDNRCTMHYAVPDYDRTQLRRMLRCALLGEESGTFEERL